MADTPTQSERNCWIASHPVVRKAILLFAAGFVLAAWGFSADRGYIRLALCVVTGLVAMAVMLSLVLARIWRHDWRHRAEPMTATSFLEWARGQMRISDGNIRASVAVVEILLPITAAVIGMAVFAIVREVVAGKV
jgi:hypothetical protein